MCDHHVAIDGDGKHGEDRDSNKPVAEDGEQKANEAGVDPRALAEQGRRQREVEHAEHEVRQREVDDENPSGIVHL